MKKIFTILAFIAIAAYMYAQAPQKISYQAVIRNSNGQLVSNHAVSIKISILQGTAEGTVVYSETQTPTTNSNGLISIEIGGEAGFNDIDWANGPFFIKTETDPTGGTSYSITGTSQLLSVPYALHSKTAETITGIITETDPTFTSSQAANITATDIINLGNLSGTNTGDQDLSSLATQKALGDSMLLVRTEITGKNQTLALSSNRLTISGTGGNTVTFDKWDTDTTNDVTILDNQTIYGSKSFISTLRAYGGINIYNSTVANLAEPVNSQDAATKAYVDELEKKVNALKNLLIDAGLSMTDVEGNLYNVVKIGTQVWMAENLKAAKYNDGTPIPLITDNTAWSNLTTPGYCWYKNDQATYGDTYGALYNWYAVNTGNLCPIGWHVPTDAEWTTLTNYIGGVHVAGGKLKETGTSHWSSPNTGATNETGFTSLPGSQRYDYGIYYYIGVWGFWWSSTEYDATYAWYWHMGYSSSNFYRSNDDKNYGYSVRCLKD